MKIYLNSKNKNYIVSIAIGPKHKDEWIKYTKNNWIEYCKKHDLGLIIFFKDLISNKNKYWKKANWQKLLIGSYLKNTNLKIKNICFLDIDILINTHHAPNIFNYHNENKISVVSERNIKGLNLIKTLKTISFNRNHFYSKKYPLDSSIFMSPEEIFKFHKFKLNYKKNLDYFCTGVYVFNLIKFSDFFDKIYFKYPPNFQTTTGGEEPILNFELQKLNKINLLDYKFQTLWIYEMANKYPFLYDKNIYNKELAIRCLENSLINSYFLHFAGSWGETDIWKMDNITKKILKSPRIIKYIKYLDRKVSSKPKGKILP